MIEQLIIYVKVSYIMTISFAVNIMFDVKNQFPIFKQHPSLIYLDNAATTQKPQAMIDATVDYYTKHNGTIYRGIYDLAEDATALYEQSRTTVARYIGADAHEVVFVKNATEGINLVAFSWAQQHVTSGDTIVLTEYEHHANILPWQRLAEQKGATIIYIPVNEHGILELNSLEQYITSSTKLVACSAVSNVTGAYTDITAIVQRAHKVGAYVMLDATQLVAHERVDVKALDIDFMVFSAHKLYGPTGVGALYIKKPIDEMMVPYELGGGIVREVDFHTADYLLSPHLFEAGTPPVAQAVGFAASVNWLMSQDMQALQQHERALMQLLVDGLMTMSHLTILGSTTLLKQKGHIVSFVVNGMHAHDVAAYCNQFHIAVRAGHHCAQPLAKKLTINASVRASIACYNSNKDVDVLLETLHNFKKI